MNGNGMARPTIEAERIELLRRCAICQRRGTSKERLAAMCAECGRSYDRFARRDDDGSMSAVILWAVRRAWRFANRRPAQALPKK